MCTDVDRNDKSRVCVAGSVKVIGRRQIEMYSRLIHTVDHVEGELRPEFDALDGFLSHAWAVTVTGAPKLWAIRFIEEEERSARRWYGGAIGRRHLRRQHEHRAHPAHDPHEGRDRRGARRRDAAVRQRSRGRGGRDAGSRRRRCSPRSAAPRRRRRARARRRPHTARGRKVLLVDHEDSFVHTLAGYIRTTGAEVATMRHDFARGELRGGLGSDLVVLSPGPGRPEDFAIARDARPVARARHPDLRRVPRAARHRRVFRRRRSTCSTCRCTASRRSCAPCRAGCSRGLPERFTVGRYHSLYAVRSRLPAVLQVAAETEDDG